MSSREAVTDVLCAYYEALSAGTISGIARFFDDTVTMISLTGSNAVSGVANIEGVFANLLETWKGLGLRSTIGYDRSQFDVRDVQANVKIVQTRLSNFKQNGEVFETWNCTYVLCKSSDGWKISLATFDDKGSERFAEGQ